jgi:DtxR family Mn-dependent transcriptional regulator
MAEKETLSASMEDYLEAISHIVAEKQAARAKDIALRLKVNNSSVTGALRSLAAKGYINYAPYDVITLTSKGITTAEDIIRRHEGLRDFFIKVLQVDEKEAETSACGMEHGVSPKVLERLIRFTEFVEVCPRGGINWLKDFWKHCEQEDEQVQPEDSCEACIKLCLSDYQDKKPTDTGGAVLSQLSAGQKGRLIKIKGRGKINKEMKALGVIPGSVMEVERISSDNEAIGVKVKGYHLLIRKDDASKLMLELYE